MAGTAHAVAVVNGTVALDAALAVLDIGPGQEVITSPFTFAATINAILRSGASVRFADIRDDFTIDPASVAALIGPATTAIMPVHLYGLPCDMSPAHVARRCARASRLSRTQRRRMPPTVDGRRAGSFGLGCFSFYATKNVTSGEGGCVTTDDSMLAERLRVMRNQGMRSRYDYAMIGQNWRMTDVAAAIAIPQMEHLDEIIRARHDNAAMLTSLLHNNPAVTTPARARRSTATSGTSTRCCSSPGSIATVSPRRCRQTGSTPACTTRGWSGTTTPTATTPACTVTTPRSRATARRAACRCPSTRD